ncbi:hydrogenase nickel incorporation protein HypB [Allokutzneria albata]|uniref:Hydrogenase nickel incorporation protein HypB n=1 Tax=Allokutzneria albata TaxID=211114 RepID=A0A1G9WCC3_ALLAB|nr:hydrogenase nickel incorporation protein HypB [Allokutzneria albata]SDM82224.1 Hydrogenase nickel incorporation protein HypB [Allokutzneria albata]
MCATCGCSDDAGVRVIGPSDGHEHAEPDRTVLLEQRLLAHNDQLARRNRSWFTEQGILAVNLMSSPGSGKTTVLERTIHDLSAELAVSVVEGDQATVFDAERIRATGCQVVQVNTGAGCHLDADMLARALRALEPPARSVVFVENVGNLVCPALFDLGEQRRAVITSVTEGADKPLKYPHMFASADVVLLNKIDLLPHLDFDTDTFVRCLGKVNPRARVLQLSATHGIGVGTWRALLREWVARLQG